MADGFSTTFANALLNVLSNTAPTTYSTVYVELHTSDPGTAGTTGTSAGSATRVAVSFNAASSGSTSISGTPSWTNGGTNETITDIAVWTALTSGTFLVSGQLTASKPWGTGDGLQITSLSVAFPTAS